MLRGGSFWELCRKKTDMDTKVSEDFRGIERLRSKISETCSPLEQREVLRKNL